MYKLLFSVLYKLFLEFLILIVYWNFNEGFGYLVIDVIFKYKIILLLYNVYWWVFDLELFEVLKNVLEVDFMLKEIVLKFCREIILNLLI